MRKHFDLLFHGDHRIARPYLEKIALPMLHGKLMRDPMSSCLDIPVLAIPKQAPQHAPVQLVPNTVPIHHVQIPDHTRHLVAACAMHTLVMKNTDFLALFSNDRQNPLLDLRVSQLALAKDGCATV